MNDNDDDNDEDNDKAQRVIPSIIHAQDLHPAGEASSIRFLTELPKEKSDLVERSFLKARVGGHDVGDLHPPPFEGPGDAIPLGLARSLLRITHLLIWFLLIVARSLV